MSNNKETKNDEGLQQIIKYFESAGNVAFENEKILNNRMFTTATWGLALSFTIFSIFQKDAFLSSGCSRYLIIIAWIMFISAIIIDIISLHVGRGNALSLQNLISELVTDPSSSCRDNMKLIQKIQNVKNKSVKHLNILESICAILGILLTLLYAIISLYII